MFEGELGHGSGVTKVIGSYLMSQHFSFHTQLPVEHPHQAHPALPGQWNT